MKVKAEVFFPTFEVDCFSGDKVAISIYHNSCFELKSSMGFPKCVKYLANIVIDCSYFHLFCFFLPELHLVVCNSPIKYSIEVVVLSYITTRVHLSS